MSGKKCKAKKLKAKQKIDCGVCRNQAGCCRLGAWADLEEAKIIASLGLKGEFFQLEADDDFPSGYKIGTSYEDDPCTFLEPDGLCSIHKIDYHLNPRVCQEFPYEDNRIAPIADILCSVHKASKKKK